MASYVQDKLLQQQQQQQQQQQKQQQQQQQDRQGQLISREIQKSQLAKKTSTNLKKSLPQQQTQQKQQHAQENEGTEDQSKLLLLQYQQDNTFQKQQQQQSKIHIKATVNVDGHAALSLLKKCSVSSHRYLLRFSGFFVTIFQLLLLLSHANVKVFAEGNVGCHFVRTLCLQGSEVCFDDNIFGKCIPTTGVDVEDIEKTPLTTEQSRSLATMLEELQGAGLGWDHPYVQCRVQGTLFSWQKQTTLPPNLCTNLAPMPAVDFDPASALAFVRLTPPLENRDIELDRDGEEALYYYPPLKKQKYSGNGINTIFRQLQLQDRQLRHDPLELAYFEEHKPQLSNVPKAPEPQSVIDVFLQSERNRINQEQEQRDIEMEAERKNALGNRVELYQMLAASEPDPQPYQRNPPSPPTLSPVTQIALDKLERLVEKDTAPAYNGAVELDDSNEQYFPELYKPFKRYENNQREKQAQRSFFRELASQGGFEQKEPLNSEYYYKHAQLSQPLSSDVKWLTPSYKRMSKNSFNTAEEPESDELIFSKDILQDQDDIGQLLHQNNLRHNSLTPFEQEAMLASNSLERLHNSKQRALNKPERVFTEAGLVYVSDDDSAADVFNKELQKEKARELLENMLGFKRRERLDVKKPGPMVGPPENQLVNNNNSNKTNTGGENKAQTKEVLPAHIKGATQKHRKKSVKEHSDEDHALHTVDTEYAHVYVKNPIDSWNDGVRIMNELANILQMQGYFTYLTVQQHLVSFRVDSNNPEHKTAPDVARAINENRGVKNNLLRRLGVTVVKAGVGDKIRADGGYDASVVTSSRVQMAEQSANVTHIMAYMFAGAGAAAVIVIFITLILIKRHDKKRDKLGGIQTSIAGAESCSKDYQELCRARMAGKSNAAEPATCGRLTSLSKENDRPPSSRSSTSSWSEEPALTNMDISTGHMVLSYMEDHLRNKGRLQREWEALCRYEAEPSARNAAQQPQCINLNRSTAPLPYDHSRVVLNHLANAEGLDYINASTITDHDPRAPAYVAAQGPLPTTLAHFWQMIWEQGAVVIVALCRLQENGEISCARYWPEEGAEVYHIYEVHLVSEHIWCDDYLVRSFYLKNLRTSETRTVTQFHFLSWPQGGVPIQAKALLDFRRKVNKSYRGRSCPIVVHGSTGAGRTGAYILLDLVLGRMNKGAREIDIAATLEHLRDQRAGLVETRQQFEFVLMAVAEEVHAILKALPANQSNEKRDIDVKDPTAATATSTATVVSSVLMEEDTDTEKASTSKAASSSNNNNNNNKEKKQEPALSKEKGKNTATSIQEKDNKEKEKTSSTPAKAKKK